MQQLNNLTISKIRIVFFGTPEESVIVLDKIFQAGYQVVAVVTKPPLPIGRKQILTPTPVAIWANEHKIPILTFQSNQQQPWLFADEQLVINEVLKYSPELLISADFTQKIPMSLVNQVKYGGLNIHPSLLPAYRGPAPVQWQILNGETETGVSLVKLADEFDAGEIVAQEKDLINPTDTTPILLTRLFSKGADLLIKILPKYLSHPHFSLFTSHFSPSYFPRLSRADGFVPWDLVKSALSNQAVSSSTIKQYNNVTIVNAWNNNFQSGLTPTSLAEHIDRAFRAFHPWPGLWTKVKFNDAEKRMKILEVNLSDNKLNIISIQVEGKSPVTGKDAEKFLEQLRQLQELSG